jgi:ubiquinone/menaquinone biosynthesis C-methylase UbiE
LVNIFTPSVFGSTSALSTNINPSNCHSIFPDGENFNMLMQKVGYQNTKFRALTFGICSIYTGIK